MKWGWTSYRRKGWEEPEGQHLYGAWFQSEPTKDGSYDRYYLMFWARRPVLALRQIVESKKHPRKFQGNRIN
jgi:hypothetical protein